MNSNDRFRQVLKHKGTGKTMSKHMDQDDLMFVANHWLSNEIPLSKGNITYGLDHVTNHT